MTYGPQFHHFMSSQIPIARQQGGGSGSRLDEAIDPRGNGGRTTESPVNTLSVAAGADSAKVPSRRALQAWHAGATSYAGRQQTSPQRPPPWQPDLN